MTDEAKTARVRWTPGALILVACAAASVPTLPLRAQDVDERRLWDSEFLQKRQAAPAAPAASRTPPVYKRATPGSVSNDKSPGEMLGVTIWRLRPSSASDGKDSRLLLQEDDQSNKT